MRDSLVTLAGAGLSLLVLVSLMMPPSEPISVSRPTSEDQGKHGHMAVRRWLEENGVNTYSLRRPFTRIGQTDLPAGGNLMVLSLPLAREALESEWAALNRWINDGNTVLVLAGLYHLPQWIRSHEWRASDLVDAIESLTAEEFSLQRNYPGEVATELDLADIQSSFQAFRPAPFHLYPAIEHALFNNIHELESWRTPVVYQYKDESDAIQSAFWTIESPSARLALRLLYGEIPQQTAMWLLPLGNGWIYLSAFTDLISNSVLKQQDNARWFANLLEQSVTADGYVIFDDYHFGLSDLYDPEAFFADSRLHNTLLFVGAFWLIYALGRGPRLAPVNERSSKPASTDFVEAMAGFFTRRIKPSAIAGELADRLLEDIHRHTQLEGDSLWSWLQDHPNVQERDLRRLQRARGLVPGKTGLLQLTRSIHRIHKVLT